MGRKLVIGDIHGGLKGLDQVLQKVVLQADDLLIFLGDYVDGWSESAQVVDYLIALSQKQECIFIRGNHDDLAYQWLLKGDFNETWLRHGGNSTIESYERYSDTEIAIHKQFYESMLDYHIDASYRLYVHAGFQNQNGPEYEHHKTAFYWDRTLWEMALSIDKNLKKEDLLYPKRLKHFKEIYIGHTPVTRINRDTPTQMANVWNIDTGAAFKGTVSVMDVETKEFWQSDPVWKLYPDEKGRNA